LPVAEKMSVFSLKIVNNFWGGWRYSD